MTPLRITLPAFALLAFSSPAFAQPSVPAAEPYRAAVAELEKLIKHEVDDKKLPALSIALVDDQKVVWAAGFGFQDRAKKIPATAETVYRVGSVSKLFTDVAIMQLVEEGKLDLDAPVAKYVPDFKPSYKEGQKQITLRMLMAHRSGLIREPPVGNYFDPTEPSLEKTAASINGIELVYPPGEREKYSNAAIGLVGFTLQKSQNEKFETVVQRRVLDQLGMKSSSFTPTAEVKKHLADAVMWTYHGREFPAPTFELGMAPAGCMYSTVLDLAKFQSCLFVGGKVGGKQFLKPETIEEMFRPQFARTEGGRGFGLGFVVGEFEGKKRIGHGGAVYGFATTFAALPGEKLGVVVVASRDVSNAVTGRIANNVLRLMLAAKAGKPLPEIETSEELSAAEARALAGRYRFRDRYIDLTESFGKLYLLTDTGRDLSRLRKSGKHLITDDTHDWGLQIAHEGDEVTIGVTTYTKEKLLTTPPAEPPAKWKGLIGEYGWDHNTLYIYERDGKLHALIEWTEINVLTEESENVYAFPASGGMYHGEKLVFTRDATGRATKVAAARVVFERRKIDGENGETFKIKPVRPLDQLRKEALAAKPPAEKGEFLKPDLVDLATIDGMKFDIRYATDNNFLGTPFYTSAKAYMQKPAAEALKRVHDKLKDQDYGLLVYDAYRPWYVTKMFWDATPEKLHGFVADPSKGSRHNRGCAVDLGLHDLKTGKVVEMVSGYDEMTDRAFPDYPGTTSRQRWHRDLLRRAMEAEGFTVYEEEWWHYDYKDWRKYPILNKTFEELGK
jgi:CubicO group peptidase (beta-lactamase class C family)/D-alanyl-D-alanine dipeptidase